MIWFRKETKFLALLNGTMVLQFLDFIWKERIMML